MVCACVCVRTCMFVVVRMWEGGNNKDNTQQPPRQHVYMYMYTCSVEHGVYAAPCGYFPGPPRAMVEVPCLYPRPNELGQFQLRDALQHLHRRGGELMDTQSSKMAGLSYINPGGL